MRDRSPASKLTGMELRRCPRPLSVRPGPLAPDTYLTDGERLLRVVSQFEAGSGGTFASLEDCLTLEVRPYSSGEVSCLRPLEPSESPG